MYSTANINIGSSTDIVDNTVITITKGKDDEGKGIHTIYNMNIYEGVITVGNPSASNFHYGIDLNGTFNMYGGKVDAYGYAYGIESTDMNMIGGNVYVATTVAKNVVVDKRAIFINNSFTMSSGHIEAKLIGSHGVGIMVNGSLGSTKITGGYMEVEVSGKYTKGLRIESELIIGAEGSEGPTIIITGDIQNEKQPTVYYDESGIFVQNNVKIYSGNIKIIPAIVTVTITWGDMQYSVGKVWQPDEHKYISGIEKSSQTSGLIKVYNNDTLGSNIPVKASVNVNMSNSYGITGILEEANDTSISQVIDVEATLEDNLELIIPEESNIARDETIGTVSVTLSDYRK